MSKGKHRFDSGRSRVARFRDREQSSFDDDLIGGFLDQLHDEWSDQRMRTPVRFGSKRLADHLSDSTLAAAILRSGDLDDSDVDMELMSLDCDFPETLFDMNPKTINESQSRELVSPLVAGACAGGSGMTNRGNGQTFDLWGVMQGFLIGAGATVLLLALAELLA